MRITICRLLHRSSRVLAGTFVAIALASTAVIAGTVTVGGITLTFPEYPPGSPLNHCEPWNDSTADDVTLSGVPEGSMVTLQFMFNSGIPGSPLIFPAPIVLTNVGGDPFTITIPYPPDTMSWPYQNGDTRGIDVAVAIQITTSSGLKTKLNSKKWSIRCIPKEVPDEFEGCTIGFWKNHEEFWPATGYVETDSYNTAFGVVSNMVPPGPPSTPPLINPSLMTVLELGGGDGQGGENGMARQAVGALLNAASPEVNFPMTVAQVIAAVQAAYANPTSPTVGFAATHALLEEHNTIVTTLPDGTTYHCQPNDP